MIGYAEYLAKNPKISKSRADALRKEGCLLKTNGLAIMTKNLSWNDVVLVNTTRLNCRCGVFQKNNACPHVAAVIGMMEDNGGKIPVTDARQNIKECLESLGKQKPANMGWFIHSFSNKVSFFIEDLSLNEKQQLLLEMARIMNFEELMETFASTCEECFPEMEWSKGEETHQLVQPLFEKRQEYRWPVIALLWRIGRVFTEEQKEILVKEISEDEELTAKMMPILPDHYLSYFSREQQIRNIKNTDVDKYPGRYLSELLHRMLEEPPLYEEYLALLDRADWVELKEEDIKKLRDAGYEDSLETVARVMIRHISNMRDYYRVISCIPHEAFLRGWRRRKEPSRYRWHIFIQTELDLEISLREDPEVNLDDYPIETLGLNMLETIVDLRPDFSRRICEIVRKRYRAAVKVDSWKEVKQCVMILAKGEDAIASKYVSDPTVFDSEGDDLVYLTAVGMHFKTLHKIAPELKKMEGFHAAGQN